jgi:outer membrane receptor protein involved in Fe transport
LGRGVELWQWGSDKRRLFVESKAMKLLAYVSILLLSSIHRVWAQAPARDSAFENSVRVFKEVEVVGKGPVLRSGPDKKVFSVNQSLVSVGGAAADLLLNIPGLQVDGKGNITLRGATNIRVLVDGRPSLIGGGSVALILQSIPAAAIEKIEVITNPSAKYDAEGQGTINIILKKGGRSGHNGAITVSAGTRSNYNTGTNMNYRTGRADLYCNYNFQHKNTYSNGFQNMIYPDPGNATYFSNERFPSTTISNVHVLQAGIDYNLSAKNLLSINGLYNATTTGRHEYLTIDNLTQQQTPVQLSNRTNTTNSWNESWGATVNLTHQFKKTAGELDVDLSWATNSGNSFQVYNTNIFNVDGQPVKPAPNILQDTKRGKSRNYNLQLDYSLPVGKGGRLEAGARSQLTTGSNRQWDASLDTVSGVFVADYSLINFFRTNNQVHAIYVNYRQQLKAYTIQAGLRAEAGRFAATLQNYSAAGELTSTPIHINTNGLYPSLYITRQFQHAQQVQLSYTRRISRPTPREINPLPDVSDPVNYDIGNPALKPEQIHFFELTYKKNWSTASLTSGFYYNQVNHVIKHLQSKPVNDITNTLYENLPRAINTGLELIGNVRVSRIWSFTANFNMYDRINSAAPQYGIEATSGISWNGSITNDLSLAKGLSAQVRADYKAREVILQDRARPTYGFDAGAKYDFAHNRATLSFSSRDLFNTRRPAFLRKSDALLLDWQRITYSARALITFTWRFGNNDNGPKHPKRTEEQQSKRIENR